MPDDLAKILKNAQDALTGGLEILNHAQKGAVAGQTIGVLLQKGLGGPTVGLPLEAVVYFFDKTLDAALGDPRQVKKAYVQQQTRGGKKAWSVVVLTKRGEQTELFTTANLPFARLAAGLILTWRDYGDAGEP